MINLLPPAVRTERIYGRRNRILFSIVVSIFITAGLVAVIMVGSLQLVGSEETAIQAEIDENQTKILALESEVKDLDRVATRLNVVDKLYESSISFSELIPLIGSLLPQGSIINSLSLTGGNTDPLSLDVSLANADLAPILQQNLVQSELFEAADINSISPQGSDTSLYKFNASVSVSFTGSAEAKRKVAAVAAAAAAAAKAAAEEAESAN